MLQSFAVSAILAVAAGAGAAPQPLEGGHEDFLARYEAAYGTSPPQVAESIDTGVVAANGPDALTPSTVQSAPAASTAAAQATMAEASAAAALAPEFQQSASQVTNIADLRRWREAKKSQIGSFVPPSVQKFAFSSIDKDFETRMKELQQPDEAQLRSKKVAAVGGKDPQPSNVKSFAQMLNDAKQCESLEELEAWHHAISFHVENFTPPEHRTFASADVEKQFVQRRHELQLSSKTGMEPPAATDQQFPQFLNGVDDCNSERELHAWHLAIIDFVKKKVPAQLQSLALADVEKRYQLRLAKVQAANTNVVGSSLASNMGMTVALPPTEDSAPKVLASLLHGADLCKNEAELRDWRQRVASHIRENIPIRFQIPALGDMQTRFDNRLQVLRKADSNARSIAQGKDVDAIAKTQVDAALSSSPGSSGIVVLGGLALPAFVAFVGAALRARRQHVSCNYGTGSSDVGLLASTDQDFSSSI